MNHYVGIDIGGTKIAAAIVASDGSVSGRVECPTPVKIGGAAILAASIELAQECISGSKNEIKGIGIGAGGQINVEEGYVFSATDVLPGWKGLKIVGPFSDKFHKPVRVDNDVNVLAVGEQRFGAGRALGKKTIVFLALGTGVGGALIVNGALLHGAHWSGGELGHILLSMDPNARRDTGGAVGTLEAYCSGPGLVETYKELTGLTDSELTGHDVVVDADKNADGFGAQAIEKTGECLGFGLVTLSNALDPDLIVIGGGVTLGERLLAPARKILKAHALPGPGSCSVVLAELGVDAAIVGAASLVMDHLS